MGVVCCPLSPEIRAINKKNYELQKIIKNHLSQLEHYGFTSAVIEAINEMPSRYMYNEGILQDIEKLHALSRTSYSPPTQNSAQFFHDQDLRDSCLILEDQQLRGKQQQQGEAPPDSFAINMKKNQSLVVQINILYKKEIDLSEYSSSLRLFLKWASNFEQHTFGGFLKPIYRKFYRHLQTIPSSDFSTIVDEICIFVQFMVSAVTDIYGLKLLSEKQTGKLIKNQNIYNLIMTFLFKKTKIKPFLNHCIVKKQEQKIVRIEKTFKKLSKKPIQFFGISQLFTLQKEISDESESQLSKSTDTNHYVRPYLQSLKLVGELSQSKSPITKLKIIVAISKQICKDIQKYYSVKDKEVPDLDPDNLSSIVMYLLIKNGDPKVYEELLIVQSFTTTNCLTCISGYYLNVFMAAIETILSLGEQ